MLNFDVTVEQDAGRVVVALSGDLDIATAPTARDAIERAELDQPALLVVDLARVTFLDSTGMGLIAAAHLRARDSDRRLVVVRPPVPVIDAFEVTGLATLLELVDAPPPVAAGS
jgi:anti-anti-sigma factor